MNSKFADRFIPLWNKYFRKADLPICYFYADEVAVEDQKDTVLESRCLIGNLLRVQDGHPFVYDAGIDGCPGGKRYSGFSQRLGPNFEYFLSCGIPGEMEGERYKKSPQLVKEYLKSHSPFEAPGKYLVFKRLDKLNKGEYPLAAIFLAVPDVLSGLFTLANYDHADLNGVICPMGSGCASIISYPLQEAEVETPRCVLGMFDPSARPCVPGGKLTFTVPMKRLEQMMQNMDESFLTMNSWDSVAKRL